MIYFLFFLLILEIPLGVVALLLGFSLSKTPIDFQEPARETICSAFKNVKDYLKEIRNIKVEVRRT